MRRPVLKLPLTCGHWSWTAKDGTAFTAGKEDSEDGEYEGVVDADGEIMIEYAGCGSHQITIHPDFVAFLESCTPGDPPESTETPNRSQ